MANDIPDFPFPHRLGSALLRAFWMTAVAFALLCVLLLVTEQATRTLDPYDIALAGLMAIAVAMRTASSTRTPIIGYAARVLPLAAVAWLLTRAIAS